MLEPTANSTSAVVVFDILMSKDVDRTPGEDSTGAAYGTVSLFFTLFTLSVIIILAVVGNAFVVAAVLLERNLRNIANYLTLSLAIADLMVAILVMPLAAVNQVK